MRLEMHLQRMARPSRARAMQRFFKTGAGEYGEGDRFLGVTVPDVRRVAAARRDTPLRDIDRLLSSPWHEARLLAVILMANGYARATPAERLAIYRLYLSRTDGINNWDLVDVSAPGVVGAHLEARSRAPLYRLARSRNLWERRIAIVATQHFIRRGEFTDTLAIAERLLGDRHDLIHKAVGWMLREVGKRDEPTLRRFLERHAARMPRTALRYAIERFAPRDRTRFLRAKFDE